MNNTKEDIRVVNGYIISQTEKAILFECYDIAGLSVCSEGGNPKREWFPVSQCTKIHKTAAQDEMDYIHVNAWLLRKKEMI